MKREKYRAKNGSSRNTSTDSKGATFVILKYHTSALIRTERLSPTSKARREASQNKFVEKGWMPDKAESFEKIDSSKYRPKARLRFVKSILNDLRNKQNWIESRPSRAETGLAGRENGMRLKKEE